MYIIFLSPLSLSYNRASCGVRSGRLGGVQQLPIELIASQWRDPCSAKVNMVQYHLQKQGRWPPCASLPSLHPPRPVTRSQAACLATSLRSSLPPADCAAS